MAEPLSSASRNSGLYGRLPPLVAPGHFEAPSTNKAASGPLACRGCNKPRSPLDHNGLCRRCNNVRARNQHQAHEA